MAKKTESTAVNDLINLVASQGPSVKEPGADLFAEPPKKTARVTGTVPPLKGAGTVEPLPRTRAPAGTQQTASINPPPPVRVSTVMPRASSIPPIPDGTGRVRPALPPPRSSASIPRPPIPSAAKIAVPAEPELDIDLDDDEDDEADLIKTPVAQQPRAIAAPPVAAAMAVVAPPVASVAPLTLDPVYPRAERGDHPNAAPEMTGASPWFEASDAAERSIPDASMSMTENTAQVAHGRQATVELLKKLALPMFVAIVLGVFVGGYIVFDGQGGKKREVQASVAPSDTGSTVNAAMPTGEAKAEPGVATVPTDPPAKTETTPVTGDGPTATDDKGEPAKIAEPVNTEPAKVAAAEPADSVLGGAVASLPATATAPKSKPVFVDVRIDSTPSGADVSLVDRGKTTFLGTTPINASVDPSRSYDVVFTYANKPTRVEHLDPRKTTRLAITLGKTAKTETPKADVPKAPKVDKKAITEVKVAKPTKPVAKVAEPFADDTAALEKKLAEKKAKAATSDEPKAEKAVAKPASGAGVLMISSKPPCEIWVDGASTGLMTPQRAMSLPVGKHKITLVSPDKAHKKTIAVEIAADKPTKVIQDLLK